MSVSRLTELQKGSLKNVLTSKNSENAEHWSAIIDKMTADQIPIVLFIQVDSDISHLNSMKTIQKDALFTTIAEKFPGCEHSENGSVAQLPDV